MERKQTTYRHDGSDMDRIREDPAYKNASDQYILETAIMRMRVGLDGDDRKEAMLGRLERIESMLGMLMLMTWDTQHIEGVIKLTAEDVEAYRQNMVKLREIVAVE